MTSSFFKYDVLIAGGGPSAYALAASCAEKGLKVATIEPNIGARWIPNYACWADEIQHPDLIPCIDASWASSLVYTSDSAIDVSRRYAKISTPRLQSLLQVRCGRMGVGHIHGRVKTILHKDEHDLVVLEDGRELRAPLCIDASGHGSSFTKRANGSEAGWQVAYGQLIETKNPIELGPGEMILMDYRIPNGCSPSERFSFEKKPSFLYVMPLSSNLIFVEETILVGRPAMDFDILKHRLAVRLKSMNIEAVKVLEDEYCWIEMGGGVPLHQQRQLAFGAAAGMVHPATGYLISRVLKTAPEFAEAIATGLNTGVSDAVRGQLWQALWPTDQRRSWALYQFGMDILCRLNHRDMSSFFDSFFQLEPNLWQGFMSASLPAAKIARAMAQFFMIAEPNLKKELMLSGIGPGRNHLIRSVIGA